MATQLLQRRTPQAVVRGYQAQRPALLRIDPILMLAVLALFIYSLVVIYTATDTDIPGNPGYFVVRQGIYGVVGIVFMLLIARLDFIRLRAFNSWFYAIVIGANLAVLGLGTAAHGSKRWIQLPSFTFQPSEIGKVFLILALAGLVAERARRIHEAKTTLLVIGLAVLPALIVIAQPDLGSGIVYVIIATAILFLAGTRWQHFAVLGAATVVLIVGVLFIAPDLGIHVLKPYQVDRLTAFVHPSNNPQSQGYQLNQSVTAIGSGQVVGKGPAGATQTRLNFLPAHQTDFVYSVIGEAFGFVGSVAALALYGVILWRALRIVATARNLYGALVAGGVTAMLMFQVFLSVGMTLGLLPITGVPLPLMSYGGSSVIVTFVAIGLLQSIRAHGREATGASSRGSFA